MAGLLLAAGRCKCRSRLVSDRGSTSPSVSSTAILWVLLPDAEQLIPSGGALDGIHQENLDLFLTCHMSDVR